MQFSLRALLIAVSVAAVLLVLPSMFALSLTMAVWYLIPGILITVAMHGTHDQRTFAIAALATFAALTYSDFANRPIFGSVIVAASGALGLQIQRQLTRQPPRPSPPPQP